MLVLAAVPDVQFHKLRRTAGGRFSVVHTLRWDDVLTAIRGRPVELLCQPFEAGLGIDPQRPVRPGCDKESLRLVQLLSDTLRERQTFFVIERSRIGPGEEHNRLRGRAGWPSSR